MAEIDLNMGHFMQRCFDLAILGRGKVAPNPMVGAVLVHNNTIIGEGYHQKYGGAHAEVNAVSSVLGPLKPLIKESTLYVSLEPCTFYGKTPACTSLIVENKIPKVVISCLDVTPEVAGKGVAILRKAGVEVITGILEKQGRELAYSRIKIVQNSRPYVFLKFAKTLNGYFAPVNKQQFWITQPYTKRLVHKWRAEADAIIIGTNTARIDNPSLTNRLYHGQSPLRIVLDEKMTLPGHLKIFNDGYPTLVVTASDKPIPDHYKAVSKLILQFDNELLHNLLSHLYERQVGILMVEGGVKLINAFLEQQLWDEARVLIGHNEMIRGLPAPIIPVLPTYKRNFGPDQVLWYYCGENKTTNQLTNLS